MNSTISYSSPGGMKDASNTIPVDKKTSEMHVYREILVPVALVVQLENDVAPAEDNVIPFPFEEEPESGSESVGGGLDEKGPNTDFESDPARDVYDASDEESDDERYYPIMVSYVGDMAVPKDMNHQSNLLHSLTFWATVYLHQMRPTKECPLPTCFVEEVHNLHTDLKMNMEATTHALWLYSHLIKSQLFVTNCKEAFSKQNRLRMKLGSAPFVVFATYTISVFVVLSNKGLNLNARCGVPLALDERLFDVILELMDMAQEILPKQMGRPQMCATALVKTLTWMEVKKLKYVECISWILVTWYLKAAIAWREHANQIIAKAFVDGAYKLHQAPSEEFAAWQHRNLHYQLARVERSVAESSATARWAMRTLEEYIVHIPLDIEQIIYSLHIDVQMPVITCSITLWMFMRLWGGTHLQQALAEEYAPDLTQVEAVFFTYVWAIRGATIMMDDTNHYRCLRRRIQKFATVQQFERLQRAMLQDFDYNLTLSQEEGRKWLHQHCEWTNAFDESLRPNFIVEALKNAAGKAS